MRAKAFALFLALILGTFLISEAFAQFYVIPVGGGRINQNDVVDLYRYIPGGSYDNLDVFSFQPNGTSTSVYTVPTGKRLVLLTGSLSCEATNSTDASVDLMQFTGASNIVRRNWRFRCDTGHQIDFSPGLLFESGHSIRVQGSSFNVDAALCFFQGYLIDN